ncbi:MAG: GHKL domain-containing protein [Oscillospiraceae bacterium]
MEQTTGARRTVGWALALFCVTMAVAAAVVISFFVLRARWTAAMVDLSDGWTDVAGSGVHDTGGLDLHNLPIEKGQTRLYTRVLTEIPDAAALLFECRHNHYRLSVGDEVLFETPQEAGVRNTGHFMEYLPLPEHARGETLYLEVEALYDTAPYGVESLHAGAVQTVMRYPFVRSVMEIAQTTVCVAVGVALMLLGLIPGLKDWTHWSSFMAGAFSLIGGLYGLVHSDVAYLVLTARQICYVEIFLEQCYHLPLLGFVYSRLERHRRLVCPAVVVSLANITLVGVAAMPGWKDVVEILGVASTVNQAIFAYVAGLMVFGFIKGIRFFRFFLPFTLPLFVSWALLVVDNYYYFIPQDVITVFYNLSFFLLIMVVWGRTLWDYLYVQRNSQNTVLSLEIRSTLALESYREMEKNLQATSKLKHDIKNQILALQLLLKNENYARAREYLEQLGADSSLQAAPLYCENFLINALLTTKLTPLEQAGVRVEVKAQVPERLAITDIDLSGFFSNILDNAIEACQKVEKERAFIELEIRMKETYLYVRCANASPGTVKKVNGELVSTKSGAKKSHGWGLKIVEDIVHRYGGMMDLEVEKDRFTLTAALRNTAPKRKKAMQDWGELTQ